MDITAEVLAMAFARSRDSRPIGAAVVPVVKACRGCCSGRTSLYAGESMMAMILK